MGVGYEDSNIRSFVQGGNGGGLTCATFPTMLSIAVSPLPKNEGYEMIIGFMIDTLLSLPYVLFGLSACTLRGDTTTERVQYGNYFIAPPDSTTTVSRVFTSSF